MIQQLSNRFTEPIALLACFFFALVLPFLALGQETEQPEKPQATEIQDSPFAGIETRYLANNLKIWCKQMPNQDQVVITITLPVGHHEDPVGLEGLAHLTEHVLFSDHPDKTEAEIKAETARHGITDNASTGWGRTHYYLIAPKEEWAFAIGKAYQMVAARQFKPESVDKEWTAVVLEDSLTEPGPTDLLLEVLERFPSPRTAFFEREFGFEPDPENEGGAWHTLQAITRNDVQTFFDRHYHPGNMTVTLFGNYPPEALDLLESEFGQLDPQDAEELVPWKSNNPDRYFRTTDYDSSELPFLRVSLKLFDVTAEDYLYAEFLDHFLGKYLQHKLRNETGASYSVKVTSTFFGGHGRIKFFSEFGGNDFANAEQAVEQLLEKLMDQNLDDEEFRVYQKEVIDFLLLHYREPSDLNRHVKNALYFRPVFQEYPDLVAFAQRVSAQDIARFLQQRSPKSNWVVQRQVKPWFPTWVWGLAVIFWLALLLFLLKRFLPAKIDLKKIRYVARIRFSFAYLFTIGFGFMVPAILLVNCSGWVVDWLRIRVERSNLFLPALTLDALEIWVLLFSLILPWCLVPRKVLLVGNELLIKAFSYRSRRIHITEITGVEILHGYQVIFSSRLFFVTLLHFGLFRKGLYFRTGSWRGYYFRVRDNQELAAMIAEAKKDNRRSPSQRIGSASNLPPSVFPAFEPPPSESGVSDH